MNTPFRPRYRPESRGMATAEYAVGLAGAACIACIMIKMGENGWGGWIDTIFERLSNLGSWLDLRSTRWHVPWRTP